MPQYGEGRAKNQRNMYVIGAYKKQLLDLLRLNNDFQQALLHKEFPEPNPYEINKINKSYFKEYVYDHAFVPGTTTEDRIFVCMEITNPYADGIVFKELYIQIYIFTPKMSVQWESAEECSVEEELEKRGYIGNKIDMVVDIIDRQINGLEHLSLGKITLSPRDGLRIFSYVDGYYGKQLTYTARDFNLLPPSALHENYKDGEPDYDE